MCSAILIFILLILFLAEGTLNHYSEPEESSKKSQGESEASVPCARQGDLHIGFEGTSSSVASFEPTSFTRSWTLTQNPSRDGY